MCEVLYGIVLEGGAHVLSAAGAARACEHMLCNIRQTHLHRSCGSLSATTAVPMRDQKVPVLPFVIPRCVIWVSDDTQTALTISWGSFTQSALGGVM